jgi:hypothetical protein
VDDIWKTLAGQVPDLIALIALVWIQNRTIERRDRQYLAMLQVMANALKTLDNHLVEHATATEKAIGEMHRTVASEKKTLFGAASV